MEQIDIIMPVYNCEEYIKQTLESVKKQTYTKWQLIIVEDNSTDNTYKIIKENIRDIEDKVKVIQNKKNLGVAESRNIGIKNSKSPYIAFLDADDIWDEKKLEKQLKFMKKNNYVFTYTLYTYLKNKKTKTVKSMPPYLDYKKALKNTFILTSTVMIDTRKINKNLINMPNIPSEDTATWWKILKEGNIAYGLSENLTTYRIVTKGLSSNKFKNLKRTWNIYRKQEKIPIIKAQYYFINYVLRAIKKRVE